MSVYIVGEAGPVQPFARVATYNRMQESQAIAPPTFLWLSCKSRAQSVAIRFHIFLARPSTISESLLMDQHIHMHIAEMMFIVQYNPQFYIFQQAYTDELNDQLSAADTEDYADMPDLVDE
jgi:hypothetical protein